jgi:lysophospholipase L1-like esterase
MPCPQSHPDENVQQFLHPAKGKLMYRSPWFVGIVLVLLGSSLFTNAVLYRYSDGYYRELNQVRLNPLGLADFPDTTSVLSNKPTVVFFGDSRAAEWPAPNNTSWQFINRGIGAQTSGQVAARFSAHILPLHAETLVIQVGINDLKTIALFPEQRVQIVSDCIANIQAIVTNARASRMRVILTTIIPAGSIPLERRPYWSDAINDAVLEVNAAIHSMANPDVMVLETALFVADANGIVKPEYQRDFLHLNEAGYLQLTPKLVELLALRQASFPMAD